MGSSADPLELLRGLIADRLGAERVAELLGNASVRFFNSFLLRDAQAVPKKGDYVPRVYSTRSGVDYFRPDGWVQVWLTITDQDPDFAELQGWPVAYHGTDSSNLGPILEAGLRKPGELPSVQMAHGNAGAGPDGAIYASPSLWLASHPVYSTLLKLTDDHWVQFAFKVRVRPGSYKEQASTLAVSRHWDSQVQIDPNMPHNQRLEWVIGSSSDVMVVGLMMRELGVRADPVVFGELATQVSDGEFEGAEYHWTTLLERALRGSGFLIDCGRLYVGCMSVEWQLSDIGVKKTQYKEGEEIRSSVFSFPEVDLEGTLAISISEQTPRLSLFCCSRAGLPTCTWTEVSCGPLVFQAAWWLGAGERFEYRAVLAEPNAVFNDKIHIAVRIVPTSIPLELASSPNVSVDWLIDASVLRSVTITSRAVIESHLVHGFFPEGGANAGIYSRFRPSLEGWPEHCDCGVAFVNAPPRAFVYELTLGTKTRRFSSTQPLVPGLSFTELVWAPLSKVCRNGRILMKFKVIAFL